MAIPPRVIKQLADHAQVAILGVRGARRNHILSWRSEHESLDIEETQWHAINQYQVTGNAVRDMLRACGELDQVTTMWRYMGCLRPYLYSIRMYAAAQLPIETERTRASAP
jgi:hypothetical protein